MIHVKAQERQTRNVVIVTLDGYRWQELFNGSDERILRRKKFRRYVSIDQQLIPGSAELRRSALMPFMWSTVQREGQIYGNRKTGNKVNCSNRHLLSYPGYSEMLTGFADPRVRTNRKHINPNPTVLEFLNRQEEFHYDVAAFTTWDVFPYILREDISKIPVNAGGDLQVGKLSQREHWLNEHREIVINPANSARYDEYTFDYALEYMKRKRPRVMFISLNETDEHAHGGRYDVYLQSAHKADSLLAVLWHWLQSEPDYKDQTTLIISTDHGRGKGRRNWRSHHMFIPASKQIWFAVLGPDTQALGEMKEKKRYFQNQLARTIGAFLGFDYQPNSKVVGEVVASMFAPKDDMLSKAAE